VLEIEILSALPISVLPDCGPETINKLKFFNSATAGRHGCDHAGRTFELRDLTSHSRCTPLLFLAAHPDYHRIILASQSVDRERPSIAEYPAAKVSDPWERDRPIDEARCGKGVSTLGFTALQGSAESLTRNLESRRYWLFTFKPSIHGDKRL